MNFSTEIILNDLSKTEQFAADLAPRLKAGDIVALDGSLGAGKTELCRAIIHALGFCDEVPSPTFNLVQVYTPVPENHHTPTVWHMDLYRLENPEDAFEIGIEEAFDTAVSLIEWPSKLGPYLPDGFLTLQMEIMPESDVRRLTVIGGGTWANRLENIIND